MATMGKRRCRVQEVQEGCLHDEYLDGGCFEKHRQYGQAAVLDALVQQRCLTGPWLGQGAEECSLCDVGQQVRHVLLAGKLRQPASPTAHQSTCSSLHLSRSNRVQVYMMIEGKALLS